MNPMKAIAAAPPRGMPFLFSHPVSGASNAASSRAMSTGSTTLEIFDRSHRATPIATRTTIDRHDHAAASLRPGATYGLASASIRLSAISSGLTACDGVTSGSGSVC